MKDKTILDNELKYQDLDHVDKGLVEKTLAGNKGYTRREVMKVAAATGVTLAIAENMLISGNQAIAATPKKGGTVRMASNLHGPDDQLDPSLYTSTIDYTRGRVTYNSLVQHANDLTPQPELAESFEPNSNATEWTFKLRKGVTFHDGSKFTADDVIHSMNRHLGEKSTSVIKSVLSGIKEWKKVGPYEVKAVLITSTNSSLNMTGGLERESAPPVMTMLASPSRMAWAPSTNDWVLVAQALVTE